eukprot:54348-Lingulodinium_polyedra.AAC.1
MATDGEDDANAAVESPQVNVRLHDTTRERTHGPHMRANTCKRTDGLHTRAQMGHTHTCASKQM